MEATATPQKETRLSEPEPLPLAENNTPEKKQQVSGLSLKSINAQRRHKRERQKKEEVAYEAHEPFTEEQVLAAWDKYIQELKKNGQKILPSVLATDQPKLKENVILIELPNETMKSNVEKEKAELLSFLKRDLRNSDISLKIKVNAAVAERKAYTPQEKYEKLKEKNPLLEDLKNTFGLDI